MTARLVFGCEDTFERHAHHLMFGPTEHVAGTLVPAGHPPFAIGTDDGRLKRAIDHLSPLWPGDDAAGKVVALRLVAHRDAGTSTGARQFLMTWLPRLK
jgi:hypothetical protein